MRRGRLAAAALLACALLALWGFAFVRARGLAGTYTGVSVRIFDAPVSQKALAAALENVGDFAPRCTAAWTRSERVQTRAETLGKSASLRVLTVYGDMREASPLTLLSGSFPAENDFAGCLLDAKSAWALFGSIDVAGAKLLCGENAAYTVRGVAECGERCMFIRSEGQTYENLEFAVSDLSTGRADVAAFLYQYALSADYALVQSGLYARILLSAMALPALAALLLAGIRLLRRGLSRGRALLRTAALLGAAGCFAGLLLLGRSTLYWPQAFLPTKCSDFAFWGTQADGWREAWETLSLMTPLPKELAFYRGMRAGVCALCAILFAELCALLMMGRLSNLAAPKRPTAERPAAEN